MNVLLYKRVASIGQIGNSSSLKRQHEQLTSYCERESYNVVGCYEDFGCGNSTSSEQFSLMLEFVKSDKNKIDLIIFTKLDRLSRSRLESLAMLKRIEELGVTAVATVEPIFLSI